MKKVTSLLIACTLIVSLIHPKVLGIASAEGIDNTSYINSKMDTENEMDVDNIDEDIQEVNEDFQNQIGEIADEVGIENVEELNAEITEATEDNITLESNIENEDLSAKVEVDMDAESENIKLTGEVTDSEGQTTAYDYDVEVNEVDGEKFKVTFTDSITGETIEYDNTELSASIAPYVFYIIGATAVKIAINYVGKKAVITIGKRTFKQVSNKTAKSALKNFKDYTVTAGKYKITVTKSKMSHVLETHHPRYWTGKQKKNMYNPDLSINDVKNIINTVIRKNSSKVEKGIKNGQKTTIESKVNGVKYRVIVTKDKRISTAFPVEE
ncbi:SAR2788 family putative toxin (plasmid) [Niallia taxi]|uniref:SAR2788 family putative toxin n=1 Tax=Niallia taxi TaxID=2499688 RepID=UPI0029351E49|nr:SAR2788 family putative toxin [Niallia taxi]WOD65644.1 SAR2788 family putative toxin [Niallia taxi]